VREVPAWASSDVEVLAGCASTARAAEHLHSSFALSTLIPVEFCFPPRHHISSRNLCDRTALSNEICLQLTLPPPHTQTLLVNLTLLKVLSPYLSRRLKQRMHCCAPYRIQGHTAQSNSCVLACVAQLLTKVVCCCSRRVSGVCHHACNRRGGACQHQHRRSSNTLSMEASGIAEEQTRSTRPRIENSRAAPASSQQSLQAPSPLLKGTPCPRVMRATLYGSEEWALQRILSLISLLLGGCLFRLRPHKQAERPVTGEEVVDGDR
jgi:hypothetical protein